MGGQVVFEGDRLVSRPGTPIGTTIDAADCPDIIPVLTVAAALSQGHTEIIHAERLRLKECDRLKAMATELNKLGAGSRKNRTAFPSTGWKNCPGAPWTAGTTTGSP